jgi:pilus assembly protein CpaB
MSRVLVLVASVAAGGGAAWLTLSGQPEEGTVAFVAPSVVEPAHAAPRLEEVLVAATDLEHRRRLAADDLQWLAWPKDALSPGHITRAEQPDAIETLSGSMVQVAMFAGEPVRAERVTSAMPGFLSAQLPRGKRAVAVRISAETTAGGFILPDDRVDVLHTTTAAADDGGTGRGVSRTLVTNIRVLAVDQLAESEQGNTVAMGRTATLELAPRQAEIIAAAEVSGTLSLALRSLADNHEVSDAAVETERSVRIIGAGRSQIVKSK